MTGATLDMGAKLAGRTSGDSTVAYALAFAQAVESALQIDVPPRAVWLRALMAELERLANHFGDIGAICNDASFSLAFAECGILRERTLRAAGGCFGHRLMMDRIVPGGVTDDLGEGGIEALRALLETVRTSFPGVVEIYDNTASLQDRTVTTGYLSPTLARAFGAGGYVGRASGRAFDARKAVAYAPYDELEFEAPVRDDGDVNARVWIRIREVEQSLKLIDQILERLPEGKLHTDRAKSGGARGARPGRGLSRRRARRGAHRRGWADRALPYARSVLVPMAAARSRDRRQHRRRLPAVQQILQLLLFGPRPLGTNMRRLLFKNVVRGRVTEPAPKPDDAALAELAANLDRAARRKLGRSLAIREVDAGSCNGCELEIHALNNAFYDLERFGLRFVASPRHADVLLVTGPVTKNMREALERTYAATPDPKWVVAVGNCAADGGIFAGSYAVVGGVSKVVPVDLHIKGCPPTPEALLKGLLALISAA